VSRQGPIDEQAKARDHAVDRLVPLDLHHHAPAGLVPKLTALGDDTVDTGSLITIKPHEGIRGILRRRRQKERRDGAFEERGEASSTLLQRTLTQVVLA